MLTPWGYEVDSLPDLMTVSEFNALTDNAYASDSRVDGAIAAATAAIRNYCGWHVAPSLECTFTTDGEAGDLWLPCVGLTAVDSVEYDGEEQIVKGFNRLGRVRCDSPQPVGIGNVTATYTAGYSLAAVPDLLDVVKDRIIACIALGYGVASETAGNVSVSWSTEAVADRGGAYIPPSVARALSTYRLVRAYVA